MSESDRPQPVAWVAFAADASESVVAVMHREEAEEMSARHGWAVAPLYRSPTLTDAEREAIEEAAHACGNCNGFAGDPTRAAVFQGHKIAATLRGLLERTQLTGKTG